MKQHEKLYLNLRKRFAGHLVGQGAAAILYFYYDDEISACHDELVEFARKFFEKWFAGLTQKERNAFIDPICGEYDSNTFISLVCNSIKYKYRKNLKRSKDRKKSK